ncbi:MAG: hypothetical protein ACI9MR_003602 [Myxococcota bacterium]|jgi:hypothetical protein
MLITRSLLLVGSLASLLLAPMLIGGCGSTQPAQQATADAKAAVPCAPDDEGCRSAAIAHDHIGAIKADVSAESVVASFGEPEKMGESWEEGATGMWVQDWHWPARGIEIAMGSTRKDGAQSVYNYTVSAPFAGTTTRGIGIGATEAEVTKAYAGLADPSFTTGGKIFIAGSVYGGVFFNFDEGGRVESIFIGAGAE